MTRLTVLVVASLCGASSTGDTPRTLGAQPGLTAELLRHALMESDDQTLRCALDSGQILDLERFEVLTAAADIVDGRRPGEAVDLGDLRLWRGHVAGEDASSVFVGVSRYGIDGFVRVGSDVSVISGRPGLPPMWGAALVSGTRTTPSCEVRRVEGADPYVESAVADRGDAPCRVATLAIDSDWEFTDRLFDGDAGAAAAYALTLAAGVSEIFEENVNVRLEVPFVRVWSEDDDPYDPSSGIDMLDQFRNEWTANMGSVNRTVAHILSGRTDLPYGGVAWLSVLCNSSYGYGVSGYLNGFFPHPLQDNHSDNWDLVVMAHELGHNFGTMHTHDGYSPPIDNCGNGDCSGAADGTIMSYCHICDGGIANIRLGFHDRVQGVILGYLDSIEPGCDLIAVGGGAIDDWAHTLADQRVVIDVLLNDAASDCDGNFEPVIESFDEVSAEGGVVKLVGGVGFWTELAYTPAAGFSGQDSFTYTLVEGGTAEVIVSVDWLRPPDDVDGLSPGAAIEYFALESPQVLPDFDALSPYYDDVLPQIGIVSTDGPFATSGRFDEVGAVVTGYLSIPETGLYTLSIESDDGSRLSIGGSLVIDNDGLHGMVERFGTIGLMAGMHEIRIDFFENGGNAGLIARFQGPGIQRQTIPSWVWFHGEAAEPCPEDVNGDGVVDVGDLLAVIDSWGDCDNCSADVDGSGSVGADDLLAVIARWNQVC